LLTLALAACGGGGGNSSSTTSAPTTTASSTPATAGSDAAATARAQKLVLVQSDFPAGWTGTAPTPDTPDDKATNEEFANCVGASGESAKVADVKGDNFSMGSPATQVGSEAQIVKDEATYRRDVAALKGPKFQPCLQSLLTKALTKAAGGAPANVQVSQITVPSFGDVTAGLRMTAGITVQGQNLTLVLDAVAMAKNRAEVTGTFSNLAQPFDAALEQSLIKKLGAKLTA
jgi:hypothetical protein